jgi:hypothetical protein
MSTVSHKSVHRENHDHDHAHDHDRDAWSRAPIAPDGHAA